jgi:hypothetical protein
LVKLTGSVIFDTVGGWSLGDLPVTFEGPVGLIFCVVAALLTLDGFVTNCDPVRLCVLVEVRFRLLLVVFLSICAIARGSILSEKVVINDIENRLTVRGIAKYNAFL